MGITKRELSALSTAIVYGWELDVSPRGVACWDGDRSLPFKAFASLESLVKKGLMVELPSPSGWRCYRAAADAQRFRCKAEGCQRGWVFQEDDNGRSSQSGKCETCSGKGVVLTPNAALSGHPETQPKRDPV